MISRQSAEDFISNEQAIIRKGLDQMTSSVDNISNKHLKRSKKLGLKRKS